jgi:hypothetical protein
MGSQYRSSLESMILYVLAAPGAGKSAVAPHLRAFLPDQSFWIGTRSWVPPKHWQALPSGRHHRPGLATSSWYGPLLTRSGRSAPSCSSVCTPQQLSDWPNGEWLLPAPMTSAGPGSLHVAIQPKWRKQSPMPPPMMQAIRSTRNGSHPRLARPHLATQGAMRARSHLHSRRRPQKGALCLMVDRRRRWRRCSWRRQPWKPGSLDGHVRNDVRRLRDVMTCGRPIMGHAVAVSLVSLWL